MSTRGFIYVLENESMPGIVKVGMTTRLPESRAAELYTTGVPTPFTIAMAVEVSNVDVYERYAHAELSEYRISDSREFFKVSTDYAIYKLLPVLIDRDIAVIHADIFVDCPTISKIADICGVRCEFVPRILDFVSNEAWNAAAARYQEWSDSSGLGQTESGVEHGA